MKFRFILLILTLTFLSCDSIEELSLVGQPDVKIRGFENGELALDLLLKIHNPNSRSFKVKNAKFTIAVDDSKVANSSMDKAISIKANSTEVYAFPMKVKLNGDDINLGMLLSTLFKKQIHLKIDGDIKAGSFFISQKFPIEWEENVSL
jgi:LEA14-like dessication related protein